MVVNCPSGQEGARSDVAHFIHKKENELLLV